MLGRNLTHGEIKLAQTVYQSVIKYEQVKIFNEKWAFFQPDNRAMAPNGNIYYSKVDPAYRKDFSVAGVHIDAKATFIHELAHVWQHQNGVNVIARGTFERDYNYLPLDEDTDFYNFNIEQQGQIIRDYFYLLNGFRKANEKWPHITVYKKLIPFLDESANALSPDPVLPIPFFTG
jgi:hypothetical protein